MKREVVVSKGTSYIVQDKIQDRLNKGWKPVLASVAAVGSRTFPEVVSLVFFEKDDEKEELWAE